MFRSGEFVADHVSPTDDPQVQPNGVDLTLEAVFEQRDTGWIARDDVAGGRNGDRGDGTDAVRSSADKAIGDRSRVDPDDVGEQVPDTFYLAPGGYVVRYGERIAVPDNHVGFLYPRSSLLRNSCMLDTAVWDAGYEGRGEGLLEVYHDVAIERGARIGQLVFAAADHEGLYAGDYQEENLD
jgi:dUTP pyrophosphatase